MFKNNLIIAALVIMIGMAALFFSLRSGLRIFHLASLTETVPLSGGVDFTPYPYSSEEWGLKASYTIQGRPYEEVLDGYIYRNEWAAKDAAGRLVFKRAWINPTYPSKTSLTKFFPWKEVVYSLILWGLVFYFFMLKSLSKN